MARTALRVCDLQTRCDVAAKRLSEDRKLQGCSCSGSKECGNSVAPGNTMTGACAGRSSLVSPFEVMADRFARSPE